MTEQVTYQVSLPDTSKNISLFPDDTIETVRMRIGMVAKIHPDRMRIYVQADLPEDYYSKDSRRWEILFLRMSPEGKPIRKPSLDILASHTDPAWTFQNTEISKDDWMSISPKRESSFTELRMLGTTEDNSWFLPLDNTTDPPFIPPSARIAIESKSLFNSIHPYKIRGFKVIVHQDGIKPILESVYYPLLRSGSPALVPEEIARSISREDELLNVLVDRESPAPTRQTVLRARWKIPLVDTEIGQAPRNRFEQIFYGTTVNKNIPCISFFGSRQEQSRHKFFNETPEKKESYVDLRVWQYWWNANKPTRNKPSILFFRGSARFDYDRITVNSTEITVSCHRLENSDETLNSLQENILQWIKSIDGMSYFLEKSDLDTSRWEVQDVALSLKYSKELKEGDFRRFGCLRGIYEVIDHDKLMFKLLRSNQLDLGLNLTELRVVQLLRDNTAITPAEVAEELDIYESEASSALTSVREKLEDNPDLLDRQYSNIPTFKFTASNAYVTNAIDNSRIIKYVNILREILMNPGSDDLDDVCPSRMESVESAKGEIAPVILQESNSDESDFLDDLLGEISEANTASAAIVPSAGPAPSAKPAKKIATKGTQKTLINYLLTQLREFDPETFDPDDPQVLRKCDKPRQPIILTPADVERLKDGEFDPRGKGSAHVMDLKDPDGLVICPEYWCTYDRIPLSEFQLGDTKSCPVCGGKVRSTDKAVEKTQDVIEYPVIQRDSAIAFPGYVKYKSKKNDKPIPCCFTTAQTTKVSVPKTSDSMSAAEAFYVLGETKTKLGALRLGYIPKIVGRALGIPLNYKSVIDSGNRIQGGQSGFYRVGVGHAADTLPNVLQFSGSVKPPIQNVDATMRCSFFRSWRGVDEDADESIIPSHFSYREQLAKRVASIDKAFKNKMLSPLEELEYCAISLDCQMFVLYASSEEVQMGCFMSIGAVRSVNRSIAVMIGDSGDPEYISHVARVSTTPQFTANLYKYTVFPATVLKKLIDMRQKACVTDIPTIDNVFALINSLKSLKNRIPEMKIVLDPYGRAQAVFVPELVFFPFKPTSQVPTFIDEKISGYSDISSEELPYKADMLEYLEEAVRVHPGFTYMHDVGSKDGVVVELITASGLRIPVQTNEYTSVKTEITDTIRNVGEDVIVWGEPDKTANNNARAITYEAEVFEFLLFQLSYDIQNGEDYYDLKEILSYDRPTVADIQPYIRDWMTNTLQFSKADQPPKFVKKMRTPCSEDDCDGSMCAWDGASCRVEIKKVRPTLDRAKLEKRLVNALVTNEKIRDIVWKHKTSPFFSSILYLELPNELILSDVDVAKRLR